MESGKLRCNDGIRKGFRFCSTDCETMPTFAKCENKTFNFTLYTFNSIFAGMVELVDSVDLGSTGIAVQVRVLLPAPSPFAIIDTMVAKGDFLILRLNT